MATMYRRMEFFSRLNKKKKKKKRRGIKKIDLVFASR